MSDSAAAVRLEQVAFAYPRGEFRLRVPEFSVAAGESVAVIGPSGSGKTTLLHLIAGILAPSAGRVTVADTVLSELPDSRRRDFRITRIGLVFQDFELVEYLDVLDNVVHAYRVSGALRLTAHVRYRAQGLATEVGIGEQLRHRPAELSQGERQRVAICRALLSDPNLLLADEATGNLDPAHKHQILDLLLRAVTESGRSLVAVTHDHELLERFDRVVDFADFRSSEP